eukprot:5146923-Alexandrium_andersonii.AAC.1
MRVIAEWGLRQKISEAQGGPDIQLAASSLDVELASVSNRVAIASRIADLRLASESNLGWVFPDLRV